MNRSKISLVVLFGLPLALLVLAPRVVLLTCAGALIAVGLRGLSDPLARRIKIPRGLAMGLVMLAIGGLLWGLGYAAAAPLSEQIDKLIQALPGTWTKLREITSQYGWAASLVDQMKPAQVVGQGQQAAEIAGTAIFGTVGILGDALFLLLIGVYMAVGPSTYLTGLSDMLAPALRTRFDHTLMDVGQTIRSWLAGQLLAMLLVGVAISVGLWLIGVELAFVLGALAGLLNFIPTLGAFLGAVPALLLALAQVPELVLPVAGLFLAVQFIEGNFLTPMVQSRAADVPPALLLAFQLMMGTLFGLLGLALAAPLLAVLLVVVRRGYVQGFLRDEESRPDK